MSGARRIVALSGYFDPVGVQHVLLIEDAVKRFVRPGDLLVVGVNSDACTSQKKGQPPFQDFETRRRLVQSIKGVDKAVGFPDDGMGSASLFLQYLCDTYPECEIGFCNGGDRAPDQEACPEEQYLSENGLFHRVQMMYGVGGEHKAASSSNFLREWVNNTMVKFGQEFRIEGKY